MTDTSRAAKIRMLRALMTELYLSTACAADNHLGCRHANKETALVCCCECGHGAPPGPKPQFTGPLLHLADRPERQLAGYIYRDGMGRRADLIGLATAVVLEVRADPPERKVFAVADKIALFFAPRFG